MSSGLNPIEITWQELYIKVQQRAQKKAGFHMCSTCSMAKRLHGNNSKSHQKLVEGF